MSQTFEARLYWRGDTGYEQARCAGFNQRVPPRFPDVIVRAASEDDVLLAVNLARTRGMPVTCRAGGHNWQRAFLRNGGMLIDVGLLRQAEIDQEASTAAVGPGLTGTELARKLRPHGLFFPTGHCTTVGLGGFLLQGGFGWNSRKWGPACASVEAIDVVTAAGELVHANARQHSDLFWAARGSGHGFFGCVTRFHLRLRAAPKSCMVSSYVYPVELLDEVLRWAHSIRRSVAREVEAMVFVRRGLVEGDAPAAMVLAPVLADSDEKARAALAIFDTCPVLDHAISREVCISSSIDELLLGSDEHYPAGRRFAVDNMWTDTEEVESLLPAMHDIVDGLPPAPSHMMWMLWGPAQALPDMAFSVQAELYIALYAVYGDADADARSRAWATGNMRGLEPLATGIQLADENVGERPFRFLTEANMQRLADVRRRYDPDGMFHSWMVTP